MKLVEIKYVRVGQIWEIHNMLGVIELINSTYLSLTSIARITLFPGAEPETESIFNIIKKHKLIGFLSITHEITDNKLVEIPRTTEFQTDDVVKFKWDPRLYVINREIDFGIKKVHPNNTCFEATNDLYGSRQLVDFELKRVGILGVTHEFVNERLVK